MSSNLLHVFQNTPMGRETYFHALYFCEALDLGLTVYIPKEKHIDIKLGDETVRISLDASYLTAPESAATHASELAAARGVDLTLLDQHAPSQSDNPGAPEAFACMTCPRAVNDLAAKPGLGFIGAKVRQIINAAHFPVLVTSPVYKDWKNITVLYGGSANSIDALRLGLDIARQTGMPLNMLTHLEETREFYQNTLEAAELTSAVNQSVADWQQFENGKFEDHLYAVPHDSLVLAGAYGHGIIKDLLFGSKLEKIQETLTNNILIVGPQAQARVTH